VPRRITLYIPVGQSTRVRDFQKMLLVELIKIEKSDKEEFIEPNFEILEHLRYYV